MVDEGKKFFTGPLGKRIRKRFLEPGEKPSRAEPKHIEEKGGEWLEKTAKGWCDSMLPKDATESDRRKCIRAMKGRLRSKVESWERKTWRGIKDFIKGE